MLPVSWYLWRSVVLICSNSGNRYSIDLLFSNGYCWVFESDILLWLLFKIPWRLRGDLLTKLFLFYNNDGFLLLLDGDEFCSSAKMSALVMVFDRLVRLASTSCRLISSFFFSSAYSSYFASVVNMVEIALVSGIMTGSGLIFYRWLGEPFKPCFLPVICFLSLIFNASLLFFTKLTSLTLDLSPMVMW